MSALPAYAAAPIAKPATNGVVCIQSTYCLTTRQIAHQAFLAMKDPK